MCEGSVVKGYVGSMFRGIMETPICSEFDVHVSFAGSISGEEVAKSSKAEDAASSTSLTNYCMVSI